MTWSTTGPELSYFSIFSRYSYYHITWKSAYTWLSYQESPLNLSHMDLDTCIFGILDHNVMVASLTHPFSTLTGEYPKNSVQSTSNPALSISKRRNTPNIHNIWNISQLLTVLLVETEANLEYSGLETNTTANFSNNTGYTLQLQASTQLTILRSVLDHNPSAITKV